MVILGSFFVMNLILGVLSGEFSKVMIVFLYPAADATASLAPTPVSNSVLSPSLTVSDFHSDSVSGWFCLPETKYVRTICLRTKMSSGRNVRQDETSARRLWMVLLHMLHMKSMTKNKCRMYTLLCSTSKMCCLKRE